MRKLSIRFLLFNRQLSEVSPDIRYKYDFLNGIYFIICIISFIVGWIRWYENALLAIMTQSYSLTGFGLLYYLKYHKAQIENVCTLVLIQLYIFSVLLYLLNFPHTLRLSLCIHITVSFGVASFQENDTLEEIIFRADKALYRAKNGGRDTVRVYTVHEGNNNNSNFRMRF